MPSMSLTSPSQGFMGLPMSVISLALDIERLIVFRNWTPPMRPSPKGRTE